MVISYLIVSSVSQLRVTKKSILSQLGVTRKSILSLFSSFLKEESLVTIDFWHTFMGAFPSRCPISFVSLLNLLRLAAQFLSPRCSVLFASLLNPHWPRGEFTSARCLVTAGDSHKKTPDRNSSIGSFLCRLFLILRTAGRLLRHP